MFPATRFDRFFFLSKRKRSAIKTFNSKEVGDENGILQNHCSDNIEPSSKDNSENALLCSLLQASTDFFSGFPKEQVQLSKPSIRNKLVLEMVFCRIIVAIISNLNRKITLNLLCSVPCCEVQQIFFSGFQGNTFSYQNLQSKIS